MKIDINIVCNNKNEAKIIEKYFFNNGFKWINNSEKERFNNNKQYPIVIYNNLGPYKYDIRFVYYDQFKLTLKIIDAKYIIRQEKLNRIQ